MNIFVGLNDAGKSNILKALNLFFNNNTDYDTEFDFSKDFSFLFPAKSHRTKEISVELTVEVPPSFQNSGVYIWSKTWRRGDILAESIIDENGNAPGSRSRIPYTLHRIKFRYVPAVKSKEFYKYLLSELYLTAEASLNNPLVESTKGFATEIQKYTEQIHNEVNDKIGIDSQLTIPADMSDIFKALIFMTKGEKDLTSIPLDMRGDGIQSRHIPIILKYLADEDQKTRNQGSVKITSIWGYEEPETGIELLRSFDVADSFRDYSSQVQLFVTTHSPAFYQQEGYEGTKVFYVTKSETNETSISETINQWEIGKTMGLMPIVAPFIAEQEKQLKEALNTASKDLLTDIPTIFVEGITDKQILTMAINSYSPELSEMINNGQLRIYTDEGEGGCLQIFNWVHAWIYKGNKSKTLSIFDKDEAGKTAHKKLVDSPVFKGGSNCKACFLKPTEEIKNIYKHEIALNYELEHILSIECWEEIIKAGFAQERTSTELNQMLGKHSDKSKSALSVYEELINDTRIINTILLYEPEENSKGKIVQLVQSTPEKTKKEFLFGFQDTIKMIEERFL